jgi:flagellar L-ring protein precursor FlgH
MKLWLLFFTLVALVAGTGCSTLTKIFDSSPNENSVQSKSGGAPSMQDEPLRFSDNPNIGAFNDRRYRRMTRKSIEEESDVGSRAGSLWNTEGPSSYLFSQNKVHREGDLLELKLEGNAKTQVETKIQVIKKLLARLDVVPTPAGGTTDTPSTSPSVLSRDPASGNPASPENKGTAGSTPLSSTSEKADGGPKTAETEQDPPINIEQVPTRVTERLADGNYRVKGHQSFMIGKKEFRVIVTGLVRPEDFSDEGLSSNKLLDPQIEVVSLRRSLQ